VGARSPEKTGEPGAVPTGPGFSDFRPTKNRVVAADRDRAMTYLRLDSDRLLSIVDGLNAVAAASLDPDDVAEVAAKVAKVVTCADGASIEINTPDVQKMVVHGVMDGASSRHSVVLKHDVEIGVLTVAKSQTDGFTEPDFEALRLVAEGIGAHVSHALAYASVAFESRVDQLTGLGNRLAFDERLGWELSRATRYDEPISLVVFDVDDFGRMNDRYGPETCDEILAEIGHVLGQARAADSTFRIGGDEFAVIMPNTSREGAEIAAIRLGWAIANLRDDDSAVTVSAGVSQADIPDPRMFFADAEAALREVKNNTLKQTASA
jgi:diguanylate cyclase (GGDEF)-like protein